MDMAAIQKMMESSNEAQRKEGMAEWGAWMKTNAASFADMGGPAGKNTQITPDGAMQMSNDVGGYSVVQAESAEAATKLLQSSPHFEMPGATVDLMEIMQMGEPRL